MIGKLWRRFVAWLNPAPPHYDPVADGLLTAFQARQKWTKDVDAEIARILGSSGPR